MPVVTTDEVFGVGRDLPLNYVTRHEVDDKFVESLSRGKHIVIYGSSKQGKTSLRKKCLLDSDYAVVSCQNRWSLAELHSAVLKECGFVVRQSTEKTVSGSHKITAGLEAKGKVPLVAEGGGKAEYERNQSQDETNTFVPLELDPNDPNDVIRALGEINFDKFIVLEDFHYLPDEAQRDFSFSLKAFHEKSKLSFIVVGVWREENRLIGFNGDLTDRVLSVDVDTWDGASLQKVIDEGASLLKVKFDPVFTAELLKQCFDSVHIVQEACRRACLAQGITRTANAASLVGAPTVGNGVNAADMVGAVVDEQAARYRGFLMSFADGFQETDLEMPKWIIYAILCSPVDALEKGVRLRRISKIIKAKHERGEKLNNGNITQVLKTAGSLQNKKGIRPLVIDYDSANTSLNVVDKGFLIWLNSQDRAELLEELGLPEAIDPDDV
jgi:hypothetical protein